MNLLARNGWMVSPSWRQRMVVLATLAVAGVVMITLARHGRSPTGGDLCRDYVSALQWWHGRSPYALDASCGILRYSPHPPLAILLWVPLVLLPAQALAVSWDLLMLAALVGALAIIWDEALPHLAWQWAMLGAAIITCWPPLLDTWMQAQNGPLLLLLLALAWRARRHNQPVAAGIWLALATLIRVYPALLFLVPLLRREWRLVRSGLLAGIGVTLGTLLLIGPAAFWHYVTIDAPGASGDWINDAHNVSWRGLLGDLFIGNNTAAPLVAAPHLVGALYVLGAMGFVGLIVGRARAGDVAWLLSIPVFLLISPLAWPHYGVVLLLPWLVLAGQLLTRRRWGWSGWLLLGSVACFYLNTLGQLTNSVPRPLAWPYAILIFALPCYGLLLTGAALLSGFRQPVEPQPAPPYAEIRAAAD